MAQIGKKILYFFTAKTLVIYKETRFECDIDGNVIFRLQEMLHVRSSTVHVRESSSVICDFAPLEKRRHKGESRRFSSDFLIADEKSESESDLRNKYRYSSLVWNLMLLYYFVD